MKPKKKPHLKQHSKRNLFRNAARPVNHAPRRSADAAGDRAEAKSPPRKTEWTVEALKTAGGAVGAALACAYISRENWIPPLFVTTAVSAVGGALAALGRTETLRSVSAGVMAGAGSQALLMLIDNHYDNLETQKRIAAAQAEKAAADKAKAEQAKAEQAKAEPAKASRSAESLPPGALEAAYERARARLAMAQAASQMAA